MDTVDKRCFRDGKEQNVLLRLKAEIEPTQCSKTWPEGSGEGEGHNGPNIFWAEAGWEARKSRDQMSPSPG